MPAGLADPVYVPEPRTPPEGRGGRLGGDAWEELRLADLAESNFSGGARSWDLLPTHLAVVGRRYWSGGDRSDGNSYILEEGVD